MSDKVTPNQLKSGDIFLYHGSGFISEMIRRFDGSQYSHAALFNGEEIVEAIGSGIAARPINESVAGATYVDVYRFVSADGQHQLGDPGYPAQPILDTSARFVATGERYAYEQIVLLALLAATRRIPVVSDIPFLRWFLRTILDNAAEVINKIVAAGKEPMICSELVYRCYTESGPQYDLVIRGADTLSARLRSAPPIRAAAGVALADHAHEAGELQAELDTFVAKYQLAKRRARQSSTARTTPSSGKRAKKLATITRPDSTALAVADFVTPRDLRDSPDLYKIGTLQA